MQLASSYKRIVVLTGAGISKAAGLATYRGEGGLWSNENKASLSDVSALRTRRREVIDMFWGFRLAVAKVKPTIAHRALAAFEERLPEGAEMTIITQNVDGLHQAAGSRRVVEYHGGLARWMCERCGTAIAAPTEGDAPSCCDLVMRPAVVMFGELIPPGAERAAKIALRDCDLFVAIGTSGSVQPAASFVRWAEYAGARRVLLNLGIFDGELAEFTERHEGTADDLVPQFFR
jgi:NAD-dependent deacetylase